VNGPAWVRERMTLNAPLMADTVAWLADRGVSLVCVAQMIDSNRASWHLDATMHFSAEYLDWISTGCYYPIATRDEARALHKEEGGTVEAAADLSSIAVANSVPVYAGLYVLNYKDQPQEFAKAITAAARHSQGVMIFDLSYVYDYAWWNILEQAFPAPAISPHLSRELTARLRAAQDAVRSTEDARASSGRLPAVPYQPGGG